MGDGGSGGDPGNRAQNLSVRLGKLLRLTTARLADRRLRPAEPVALLVGPADEDARDRGRRPGPVGGGRRAPEGTGLANLGWSVYEGRAKFKSEPLRGSGKLVFPGVRVLALDRRLLDHGRLRLPRLAVPSARGRYFFGDYCSGNIWAGRVSGRSLTGVTQVGHLGGGLSSFGLDAAGELYATTLDGKVYRLS